MKRGATLIALLAALLVPAAAAAAPPVVTTGAPSNVAADSVIVGGKVDPNGVETTYYFEYGPTTLYGAQSAPTSAGSGGAPINVSVGLIGLSPVTRYHYRLVAVNANGRVDRGADRTFRTKVQPLGISTFSATPNPLVPGSPATLSGVLEGSNKANRDVVLQANPWPFAGFVTVGNPLVTGADGSFSFSVVSVPVTTQFRVVMAQRPEVISPVVVVEAVLQVKTKTKKVKRYRRSVSVRFSGSIAPGLPGTRMAIQRNRKGVWTTVATTRTEFASEARSTYNTRIRVHRTGSFRVVAEPETKYSVGIGRTVRITAP